MHTFPRPQEPHLSVERVARRRRLPRLRGAGARRPTACSARAGCGTSSSARSAWPRCRASARRGSARCTPLGLDASDARRRRRRHVHRRGRGPRRAHRGDQGPERRDRARDARSSRARAASASRAAAVFNHASTMGLNAVITRRLPKIAFLTTEGFRDILDRGTSGARSTARPTPPGGARSATPPARSSRATCAAASSSGSLADGSVLIAARRGPGAPPARGAAALRGRGRRDLPAQRLRQPRPRGAAARAHPRGAGRRRRGLDLVGDLAAGQGVRARVDDGRRRLHEAHLRATTRRGSTPSCASSASTGELNFADCAATLLPWREALRAAVPDRLRRARRRHDLEHAPRRRARRPATCSAPTSAAPRPTSRSSSTAQPFVNDTFELEHDLVINALSTEISSVGAGGGSIVSISPSGDVRVGPESAGADPGPACYGRGGTEPTLTDACLLMGILDPAGFAGGEMRARPRARAAGLRGARHAALARAARRRSPTASRSPTSPRRSPTSRSATASTRATSRSWPTARPARCCCPPRSTCCRCARIVVPPHPGPVLGARPAQHRPRLLRQPQRLRGAQPRQRGAGRGRLQQMERALRERVGAAGDGVDGAPQPRRAPARPELGDAVRRGAATGRSPTRRCPRWSSASTTATSAATATASRTCRCRASPTACSSSCRPTRSSTSRATAAASRRRRPRARSSCATSPTSRSSAAEYERESLPVGAVIDGPAIIREALSTTFVCPARSPRSAASARS